VTSQTKADLLAENEELRLRISELESNLKFEAANQQLRAIEQQLRASNQQMEASNQQLAASNQQLRATQEQLQDSERKFRTLVTENEEIVYMIAKDGTFLLSEGKGLAKLGLQPGQVVGASIHELYKDYPEMLDAMARAFGGETVTTEVEVAGNLFRNWYSPHLDHKGDVVGLLGLSVNITEQRKSEESLRLKNQVFEDSIASLSIADADGVITEVNSAFLALWGYSTKEDAIGGSVGSFFVNEEDAGLVIEELGSSGRWEGEFLARHTDGSEFITRGLATAMKNDRGALIGYQSTNIDVTEQRKAEEGIKDALENLRLETELTDTIIDSTPGVFYVLGFDGGFRRWNDNMENVTGLSHEEMGTTSALALFDGNGQQRIAAGIEETQRLGQATVEAELLHKNGGRTPYLFTGRKIQIGGEDLLIGMGVDITDKTLAEDALRKSQELLEKRVAARTIDLSAANKELEAFAYSVSHDLRAPLRGIDGFSKALLDDYQDKLDDTGKDYIHRVRAGTQRMGILIDDMLKLSRLTRAEMVHQPVDLSDLAAKIADELQRGNSGRLVEFDIATGITARGDRALLEAALDNLLGNSWKFTGRQDHARIEFGVTEQNDESVYFVRDNGAGFDMAYADKLFGAFQRLHDTTEFPGTGIGLAIVNRVVLRHGGRIWAEGEVGNGATFYFTLRTAPPETGQRSLSHE
jgi:PAS domain S-box-containing protein